MIVLSDSVVSASRHQHHHHHYHHHHYHHHHYHHPDHPDHPDHPGHHHHHHHHPDHPDHTDHPGHHHHHHHHHHHYHPDNPDHPVCFSVIRNDSDLLSLDCAAWKFRRADCSTSAACCHAHTKLSLREEQKNTAIRPQSADSTERF